MTKLYVKKYLGESTELLDFIGKNQLTYLIAGCGMGKSRLTKDVLMGSMKVLNVNFLNTTNLQTFSDTYQEGPAAVKNIDGSSSVTVNVQNLDKIDDSVLAKFDILVVDEIQKMYQDISYRKCCGSTLEYHIERAIKSGIKVLVMTGTPISGIKFLDKFSKVVVKRTEIKDSDKYIFVFKKGLTYFNISDYAFDLTKEGKVPVLLINKSWRHKIRQKLEEKGLTVGMIESDEKKIDGSCTNYIIENSELPTEDYDVFISTSVLQEGINLNNTEKDIVFLTLLCEISTPHQLIQFAGRARDQRKVVVSGFRNESEFDINYLHTYYQNLGASMINDKANIEYESVISGNFNEIEDWKNYIGEFTISKIKVNEYTVAESKFGASSNNTNWAKVIEVIKKNSEKTIVSKKIASVEEDGFKVVERDSNKIWLFTDNSVKCRQIVKAIERGLLTSTTNDLDSYLIELSTVSNMVRMVENSGNLLYKRVFDKVFDGTIDDGEFNDLFKSLFEIKYIENGKEVDIDVIKENRLSHDIKKRISKPYEIFTKYPLTSKILISKYAEYGMYTLGKKMALDASLTYNPEEMFNLEFEDLSGKTRKGIYAKYKFELSSDSSIKFKTLDEAFEYCKNNGLTKCGNKESFRKHSKDIISKIK